MQRSEIVGYRKFRSKDKKKSFCIVTVLSGYSDREVEHGAVGKKAEEIWVPEDFQDQIDEDCIGRDLEVGYYRNGNQFYVDTIDIV